MANISARGFVQTGTDVMIAGFLFGNGTAGEKVIIRALGPSLTAAGIINVLADPTLALHDSNGVLLMSDDNWKDDASQAIQIIARGFRRRTTWSQRLSRRWLPANTRRLSEERIAVPASPRRSVPSGV